MCADGAIMHFSFHMCADDVKVHVMLACVCTDGAIVPVSVCMWKV